AGPLTRPRTAFAMILPSPAAWSSPPRSPPGRCSAQFLGLIPQHLRLPADEFALQLSQFLRFLHMNQLLHKVEAVRERFFHQQYRVLANDARLVVDAIDGLASDREQVLERGPALAEVAFGNLAHPVQAVVCHLDAALGVLLSKIRRTFGHSFASLIIVALQ